MNKSLILPAALALFACACTSEAEPTKAAPGATPATTPASVTAELKVHDAMCGCSIEGIGACGNYIKVDDKYVVLEHPSLGTMDYCGAGEKGAKVKVAGAMAGDKFVATAYELVK